LKVVKITLSKPMVQGVELTPSCEGDAEAAAVDSAAVTSVPSEGCCAAAERARHRAIANDRSCGDLSDTAARYLPAAVRSASAMTSVRTVWP
jgi:hypothetical protein